MDKILILILGGSVGTLCRYALSEWALLRWGSHWPYGTFLVNMAGCLMMGCILGWFEGRFHSLAGAPYHWRLFLFTGFLGALTTFSSYELETLLLLRQGAWERSLLYVAGSIVMGLLLMLLGLKVTRNLVALWGH